MWGSFGKQTLQILSSPRSRQWNSASEPNFSLKLGKFYQQIFKIILNVKSLVSMERMYLQPIKDYCSLEVWVNGAASLTIPLLIKQQSWFTLLAFLFSQFFGLRFWCLWALLVSPVHFAEQADKINIRSGLLTLNNCKEEWYGVTGGEEGVRVLWAATAVGFDLAAAWNLREGKKKSSLICELISRQCPTLSVESQNICYSQSST